MSSASASPSVAGSGVTVKVKNEQHVVSRAVRSRTVSASPAGPVNDIHTWPVATRAMPRTAVAKGVELGKAQRLIRRRQRACVRYLDIHHNPQVLRRPSPRR
ncbi:hypothetical protein Pa4123_79940 [Phytohabitans aurantiacus]|uniref:Uncharacterized protein n=1 Tax=Phytohabitans aurantiacus TaxID=3016789 RepID=A0ABQ5R7H4_9ACTN|nr:hypothetical protein Pa4123_79940 [Phytohabitans aurantiacus]